MLSLVCLILFCIFNNNQCQVSPKTSISSFPFISIIPIQIRAIQYQYSLSNSGVSIGGNIQIQFDLVNPSILSTTFVMVSYFPNSYTINNINRYQFYHKPQRIYDGIMDIVGMQLFRKQYINIGRFSGFNTLYLTVYNLDPISRKVPINFSISLIGSNLGGDINCYSCYGLKRKLFSCACLICPIGKYGQDCSVNQIQISAKNKYTYSMDITKMMFFRIYQYEAINLKIKKSSNSAQGEIYIQYLDFQGQIASYTNTAYLGPNNGIYGLTSIDSIIPIPSTQLPILITVVLFNNVSTNIQVYYEIQPGAHVLVIILSVLGGLLFIILLVSIYFIIKKTNIINTIRHGPSVQNSHESNLSDEEIQRFFPTIQMNTFYKIQQNIFQNSYQNINQMKRQEIDECVICLCLIEEEEQVKITYCRHIFHANCLVGWFKKTQNCPYCREQFDRTHTIKLYKKLKQKKSNGVIKRQILIKAIIQSKICISTNKQLIQQKQLFNVQKDLPSKNSIINEQQ